MVDPITHFTNCTVYSTVKQSDDEAAWLEARTRGIGGSDIGAICGVSQYSSARQIYFKKTGQFEDVITIGEAQRDRMHFGNVLEPIVADEYARRTGARLATANATMQHKEFPWALANVDRIILDENDMPIAILECKTTSEYGNDDWADGDLPLSYIYQLNWYMWITGMERGAFACLVGGNKYYYYEVWINWDLVAEMFAIGQYFWEEQVMKLVLPELMASDTEFIDTVNKEVVKNSEVVLDEDVDNDLALTVIDCKAKIKELEAILEAAKNRLKDKLGTTEIGYTHDCVIKWSPRKQQRIDNDKLRSMYPEVAADCIKVIEFRAMSVRGGV